jgi:hypothetical protein
MHYHDIKQEFIETNPNKAPDDIPTGSLVGKTFLTFWTSAVCGLLSILFSIFVLLLLIFHTYITSKNVTTQE